ncbi:ferrochelatase [Pseudothauera nasutitermitis]|uniref:Ferrochelatase n=1 Tax=Pseudothauera nasutitermitis TaxID=2565930 RepID=A0A4S4B2K5_9RHOO|nr:ferrochelatase [Pseudothauera nasutitermitis]THF66880.1 ferrochelatase [Pseudothauera nasutitermitis]
MARYRPEPPHTHDRAPRTAILLVNLGTPAAPTAAALRPYLKQFLSDPRVIELPRLLWWPILNGIILNTRPRKSAEKYASVWMEEGSPLKVHTERQARLLAGYLGHAGISGLEVDWAMRYGAPSIAEVLDRLRAQGCTRILIVPMYPQYAASTTGSVMDDVAHCLLEWRNLPEIRYVRSFHDDPGYIGALAASVRAHWMREGRQGERLLLSFHGLPRSTRDQGDPYYYECHETARLLAAELGLPEERVLITFQSRFGRAEWLQPYTQPTLEALAAGGLRSVDVMCPGFVADCLETLEEIAMECRDAFLEKGGEHFGYIPCLNEDHAWIEALSAIVRTQLGHWLALPATAEAELAPNARRAHAPDAAD